MIPLEVVDTLGSTSAELRRRAAAGAGETALLARQQTAGRGRLGRTWHSPPGNLHLSLLLREPRAALGTGLRPGHWALLMAVAVAEAVAHPRVRLKWPNDVLVDGAKLAGVLMEAGADAAPWLVAGIGVNVAHAPDVGRPATCLAALGPAPAVESFGEAVVAAVLRWRARYALAGFAPVHAAWLAAGPAPGTFLQVGADHGCFAGIDADGALLLEGRPPIFSRSLS